MASSLIPINQATIDELQTLKGIGPKRAGRIVRYRLEVSRIDDVYHLANAAGIGVKQANSLSAYVEWHGGKITPAALLTPALTLTGSYLLVFMASERSVLISNRQPSCCTTRPCF